MKKRWIPFLLVCLVAVFIAGVRHGSAAEVELQQDRQAVQARLNTIIAVVNADVGGYIGSTRYNYSAAIIDNLGDDFILVSPAMAQTGFANGTYAAIVTFPPEVSTRILSFNAINPERISLEFIINEDLPEREYLETFMTIMGLQHSINTTLANTYVNSILRQFHDAQDHVDGIFRNNLSDLMALEIITLGDFTATLELDEIPRIPLNPRELDTTFYMEQVVMFATEVAGWYLHSFEMAADQYLWMREGLFALTENFPDQEDQWMEMLEDWTQFSIEYGELLEIYSEYVRNHDLALEAWHQANVVWNENLVDYQQQVANWHELSNTWFDGAEMWHTDYVGYLNQVREYMEALTQHRIDLEDSLSPVVNDMTTWMHNLQDYEQNLYDFFISFLEYIEDYNIQSEDTNEFLEALLYWHEYLDSHQMGLIDWGELANERITAVNEWHYQLDYTQYEMQQVLDFIRENLDALTMPPELCLNQYYFDLSELQLLNPPIISMPFPTPPDTASFNVTLSINPVPNPPPSLPAPNEWEIHLWMMNAESWIQSAATWASTATTGANTWLESAQYSSNELVEWWEKLNGFQSDLHESLNEIGTWHTNLTTFAELITGQGENLYQHAEEMIEFSRQLVTTLEYLLLIEPPYLPDVEKLEYIEFPDEDELYMPESVELVELIALPMWSEEIIAPLSYDGAQIAEAFTQEFPLDGNAITEPMGLDRMSEFADYSVPYIVEYQPFATAFQPLNPLVGAPPRPDNFWHSLDQMHGQLSTFEIGNFLSYDIHRRVDGSLHSYNAFLDSVREDIIFLFEDNIWLMHDVHDQYNFFLQNLRHDAFAANFAEQNILQDAIDEFSDITGANNQNTRDRLGNFASMIPESRDFGGVNQNLVSFTVSPFEFTPMEVREGVQTTTLFVEPIAVQYQTYQNIALILVGFMFTITMLVNGVLHYRAKKQPDEN